MIMARYKTKAQISQSVFTFFFYHYRDKMSNQFLQELVLAVAQEALSV